MWVSFLSYKQAIKIGFIGLASFAIVSACNTEKKLTEQNDSNRLLLISQSGRKYDIKAGISVCFATTTQNTGWSDADQLNQEFKKAVEAEWGSKLQVKTFGWDSCEKLPQAFVQLRFFDCEANSPSCPDATASPHVKFIGPPPDGQGPNVVYLRRTYQGHYRESECNGKTWIDIATFNTNQLNSRKKCTRAYGVHEFGHILGFDHEQYHPQGPPSCEDQPYKFPATGSGAAQWLCPQGYDRKSVMNYCGDEFINWDHGLSDLDIKCAKAFFLIPSLPLPP